MKKRIFIMLAVVVFILIIIFNFQSRYEFVSEDIVIYAMWSAPTGNYHPSLSEDIYTSSVNDVIYAGMLRLNPFLEWEPYLVESYKFSDDNKSLSFTLMDNLKWHDGMPVTTNDVKFTFEFIAHPDYTGPRYNDITMIKGVEEMNSGQNDTISGIEIIDDKRIIFYLKNPNALALQHIGARKIIPKHIWKDVIGADAADAFNLLRNPVGCGPFKFVHHEPDQYAKVLAYENYHLGKPKIQGIIFRVANPDIAEVQLAANQLDFIRISSLNKSQINFFEKNNIIVEILDNVGYQYLGINNRLNIFSDRRVRQAFAHSINRKHFVENVLEGFGQVLNVPIAPISWAYPPKDTISKYEYNPQKAINLLKAAGWEYKNNKMYFDNAPVQLTLKYPTGDNLRIQMATVIQQNFRDIGIRLNLSIMEFGQLMEEVIQQQNFELYLMGWFLTPDPDAYGIWHSSLTDKGGWNADGFINKKNDYLLEKGRRTVDFEERIKIYHKWAQLMNKELPVVFLYNQKDARAYNPKLKGLSLFPYSDFYNVHLWYIEK